jgi:hypothetical protein
MKRSLQLTITVCCGYNRNHAARNVLDNRKRRNVMGDKGGKKDKEKSQKQHDEKLKQKSKDKLDKQPKRKP